MAEIFASNSSSVGASAAAGMSSQCPVQTNASWSHAAEIVKITGLDISNPPISYPRSSAACDSVSEAKGLLVIQKRAEFPRPRRMLQLPQRLGLDLADALARHRKLLADFFQRVVGIHADAEAHAQHALLARRERGQHPRR